MFKVEAKFVLLNEKVQNFLLQTFELEPTSPPRQLYVRPVLQSEARLVSASICLLSFLISIPLESRKTRHQWPGMSGIEDFPDNREKGDKAAEPILPTTSGKSSFGEICLVVFSDSRESTSRSGPLIHLRIPGRRRRIDARRKPLWG
jgi:hypothetical protein